MIIIKKGNVFDSGANVIAHGCNCVGGYGAGIAYEVAQRYPKAKESYLTKYRSDDGWKLGDVQLVNVAENSYIANCATQFHFMPRNVIHADYPAINSVFKKLYNHCKANNLSIAIPLIGAGLAGGDWNIIYGIIKDIFVDWDITIYEFEKR